MSISSNEVTEIDRLALAVAGETAMTQGALLTVACHPPSKRAAVKESPHPSSRLDRTVALSVSTVDQAAGADCAASQSASNPEGPPQSSSAGATARTGEGRRCRKGARRRKAALLIEEVLPSCRHHNSAGICFSTN